MHVGILQAEKFRQTAFVTQVQPCEFVSCWMGKELGRGHNGAAVVHETANHMRIHGVKHPTIVKVKLEGRRTRREVVVL